MDPSRKKIIGDVRATGANGSIHLGHMLEHIRRISGCVTNECAATKCISFARTTRTAPPIMRKAHQLGVKPEEMIAEMDQGTNRISPASASAADNYHSTHSDENRELSP